MEFHAMTREPARFSILFDPMDAGLELEDREEPAFFADLNLDQVFDAVAASRREYNLTAFFRSALPTAASVIYRQDVFRDIESGLAGHVAAFAEQMRQVSRNLRTPKVSSGGWCRDGRGGRKLGDFRLGLTGRTVTRTNSLSCGGEPPLASTWVDASVGERAISCRLRWTHDRPIRPPTNQRSGL
jgi:hypothetical protein